MPSLLLFTIWIRAGAARVVDWQHNKRADPAEWPNRSQPTRSHMRTYIFKAHFKKKSSLFDIYRERGEGNISSQAEFLLIAQFLGHNHLKYAAEEPLQFDGHWSMLWRSKIPGERLLNQMKLAWPIYT